MGGGSLMTPLLVLVFGFKPSVAIGTDIVHGAGGALEPQRMGLGELGPESLGPGIGFRPGVDDHEILPSREGQLQQGKKPTVDRHSVLN